MALSWQIFHTKNETGVKINGLISDNPSVDPKSRPAPVIESIFAYVFMADFICVL